MVQSMLTLWIHGPVLDKDVMVWGDSGTTGLDKRFENLGPAKIRGAGGTNPTLIPMWDGQRPSLRKPGHMDCDPLNLLSLSTVILSWQGPLPNSAWLGGPMKSPPSFCSALHRRPGHHVDGRPLCALLPRQTIAVMGIPMRLLFGWQKGGGIAIAMVFCEGTGTGIRLHPPT
jgi:hypothetical protein